MSGICHRSTNRRPPKSQVPNEGRIDVFTIVPNIISKHNLDIEKTKRNQKDYMEKVFEENRKFYTREEKPEPEFTRDVFLSRTDAASESNSKPGPSFNSEYYKPLSELWAAPYTPESNEESISTSTAKASVISNAREMFFARPRLENATTCGIVANNLDSFDAKFDSEPDEDQIKCDVSVMETETELEILNNEDSSDEKLGSNLNKDRIENDVSGVNNLNKMVVAGKDNLDTEIAADPIDDAAVALISLEEKEASGKSLEQSNEKIKEKLSPFVNDEFLNTWLNDEKKARHDAVVATITKTTDVSVDQSKQQNHQKNEQSSSSGKKKLQNEYAQKEANTQGHHVSQLSTASINKQQQRIVASSSDVNSAGVATLNYASSSTLSPEELFDQHFKKLPPVIEEKAQNKLSTDEEEKLRRKQELEENGRELKEKIRLYKLELKAKYEESLRRRLEQAQELQSRKDEAELRAVWMKQIESMIKQIEESEIHRQENFQNDRAWIFWMKARIKNLQEDEQARKADLKLEDDRLEEAQIRFLETMIGSMEDSDDLKNLGNGEQQSEKIQGIAPQKKMENDIGSLSKVSSPSQQPTPNELFSTDTRLSNSFHFSQCDNTRMSEKNVGEGQKHFHLLKIDTCSLPNTYEKDQMYERRNLNRFELKKFVKTRLPMPNIDNESLKESECINTYNELINGMKHILGVNRDVIPFLKKSEPSLAKAFGIGNENCNGVTETPIWDMDDTRDYTKITLESLKEKHQYPFPDTANIYWPIVVDDTNMTVDSDAKDYIRKSIASHTCSGSYDAHMMLVSSQTAKQAQEEFEEAYKFSGEEESSREEWERYKQQPGRFSNRKRFKGHDMNQDRNQASKSNEAKFRAEIRQDKILSADISKYRAENNLEAASSSARQLMSEQIKSARIDVYSKRELNDKNLISLHPGQRVDDPITYEWTRSGYRGLSCNEREEALAAVLNGMNTAYDSLITADTTQSDFMNWCCYPMLASLWLQANTPLNNYSEEELKVLQARRAEYDKLVEGKHFTATSMPKIVKMLPSDRAHWTILYEHLAANYKILPPLSELIKDPEHMQMVNQLFMSMCNASGLQKSTK